MVRIVIDTTSCIPAEWARSHDIPNIPQVIVFGNESFLEGVDMGIPSFLERLKSSPALPKTAAPPVKEFIKAFEYLAPFGDPILCIHPSLDVSGTVRSALTAAAEFPDANIHVLDTRLIAGPLATLVQLAVEWAAAGEDIETIKQKLMAMSARSRLYFLVATLEYLQRGGRIGGAQALLGSLLQIKPILTFRNGHVDRYEQARTMRHALARLKEIVHEQAPSSETAYLTIMHGGVPEQAEALAADLKKSLAVSAIPIYNMPPAIVTHAGPGLLAVGFFAAPQK